MSDFYEEDEILEPEVDEQPVGKQKYKSTKDQTKRREQAKLNLAKGRETRANNIKKKKQQESSQYIVHESEEEVSSSESELEYELITKSKSKAKSKTKSKELDSSALQKRLAKMEELLMKQMKQAKKAKRPIRQTIVQSPQFQTPAQNNPQLQHAKREMMNMF